MQTTPLWVPILIAGLGMLGAAAAGITGALITQRRADRRHEEAWTRERERDRERWEREDEMRTFEHRREAYSDFYESLKEMGRRAYDHGYGFTEEPEIPEGWQTDTFRKLQRMSLYATPPVVDAASRAYDAAWRWGHETPHDDPDSDRFGELQELYDAAEIQALFAIRADLSIPGGELRSVP